MPKDPPRNQPNYKIGGYHINEYEYEQNHGAITKEETQLPRPRHGTQEADTMADEDGESGEDEPDAGVAVQSPS